MRWPICIWYRRRGGLGDLGRPEGYIERQLQGGRGVGTRRKGVSKPSARRRRWRRCSIGSSRICRPQGRRRCCTTITGSTIACSTAADPGRVEAVLDWDMCTQGDPLADLGYVLNYWVEPCDPAGMARDRRDADLGRRVSVAAPTRFNAMPRAPALTSARSAGIRSLPRSSSRSSSSRSTFASCAGRRRTSASGIITAASSGWWTRGTS